MSTIYDTSKQSGCFALISRLGIDPEALAAFLERAGVPAGAILEENDLLLIEREQELLPEEASPLQKTVLEGFRAAMFRCRQRQPLVMEARLGLFGAATAPFPDNMEEARRWIEAERTNLPPDPAKPGSKGLILAWPGDGDWQAFAWVSYPGPLLELAGWSQKLSFEARLLPAQSTAYILTGSVVLGHWSH